MAFEATVPGFKSSILGLGSGFASGSRSEVERSCNSHSRGSEVPFGLSVLGLGSRVHGSGF